MDKPAPITITFSVPDNTPNPDHELLHFASQLREMIIATHYYEISSVRITLNATKVILTVERKQ